MNTKTSEITEKEFKAHIKKKYCTYSNVQLNQKVDKMITVIQQLELQEDGEDKEEKLFFAKLEATELSTMILRR